MELQLRKGDVTVSTMVFRFLLAFAIILLTFGLLYDPFPQLVEGIHHIYTSPDGLITDYVELAGIGAAFVNSGFMMMLTIFWIKSLKIPFHGSSIAGTFIVAGFALFGKNLFAILPFIAGVYLYAWVKKEPVKKYAFVAIFGTCMSPMVSEVFFYAGFDPTLGAILAVLIGIAVGFILPPIAGFTMKVHQGYNLYNVGFAAGFIGTMVLSILKNFGFQVTLRDIWNTGNNHVFVWFLLATFSLMIVFAVVKDRGSWKRGIHISRHSGRAVSDFIVRDGFYATLVNMGLLGLMTTGFLLFVGADLNGPTIGGILTIVGFAAFRKTVRNVSHVFLAALIGAALGMWDLARPIIILGALFGTGIAPIGGQFGLGWGVIATMIHISIVQNLGPLHGGLNLYNNGFSGGFVAILLVPVIEALRGGKLNADAREEDTKNY